MFVSHHVCIIDQIASMTGKAMSLYKVHYCIESKKLYRGYEDSIIVSDLSEALGLIDLIVEDDTIYVDLVETKDALNINGSEDGRIFLEVNTAKGGVFTKEITTDEAKEFLKNITVNFDELDTLGFDSSSI